MSIVYIFSRTRGEIQYVYYDKSVISSNERVKLQAGCELLCDRLEEEHAHNMRATEKLQKGVNENRIFRCAAIFCTDDTTFYACVICEPYSIETTFEMLDELAKRKSIASESDLKKTLQKWNNAVDISRTRKVRKELDEVKEIMLENLNATLERGEKTDSMLVQTQKLMTQASSFTAISNELEKKKEKQLRSMNVLCIVAIVILALVVIGGCLSLGYMFWDPIKSIFY